MFVLSTGKSTILSQFDNFKTRASYQHANDETLDFQIYSQQQVFVEVNKKSGIEILRLKELNELDVQIQRVQKIKIKNAYCVACSKKSSDLIALGLTNGQVQIYNYKTSEFINRFSPDISRNSVCFTDFNSSDEYIAAVYENGQINTNGIKTKAKVDTFKVDGLSTLARFHPSKLFHLGIASSAGAATIYDIQTKKKIFHASVAHTSPCRDLCMTSANIETLLSVGYDCIVNIYDIRHKGQPQRIIYSHPLSAVTLSACGTYICVGSLNGEIISYDMRHTKSSLQERKIHDGIVTRLAFVENLEIKNKQTQAKMNSSTLENSMEKANVESQVSTKFPLDEDSFCDIIDFQAKHQEETSPSKTNRRSSFNWAALTTHNANKMLDTKSEDNCSINFSTDFVNKIPRKARITTESLLELSNCKSIRYLENLCSQTVSDSKTEEDKPKTNDIANLSIVTGKNNSLTEQNASSAELHKDSYSQTSIQNLSTVEENHNHANNSDLIKVVLDLRTEMLERIHNLEQEIKFNAETNKWHIFTQNSNICNQQNDVIEGIQETLAILLHADPFVNEYVRLKNENQQLKEQINQMSKK